MRIVWAVATIMLAWATASWAQAPARPAAAELELAQVNQAYIESEIETARNALNAAQEHLARQQQLFERGLIARRTLDQAEAAVRDQQIHLDLLIQQKKVADQTVTLIQQQLELTKRRENQLDLPGVRRVTKHYGRGTWRQRDFRELARAFRQQFGRTLPVSALGQTRTHWRLRLNHRQRMDIAVHPDSSEGRWIMDYLQESGIPFMAFRSGVSGCATGAHIHVGLPSPKL